MKPGPLRGRQVDLERRRHVLRYSILQFEQLGARFIVGSIPDPDAIGADELHADAIGVVRLLDCAEQQIVNAERFGDDDGIGLRILVLKDGRRRPQSDSAGARQASRDRVGHADAEIGRIRAHQIPQESAMA